MNRNAASGIMLTLLLTSMLTLTFNVQQVKATTLPVHNINTGEDFATIQEAIDAPETQNRHTILVDAGTYSETVSVNKEVYLLGENPTSTIINGTVNVQANNVEIRRFCIENGRGIRLGNVIRCRIIETVNRNSRDFGIILDNASNSQISFNEIYSNYYDGICLDHASNNNVISSNHIQDFYRDGIGIHQSAFNAIEANQIFSGGTGLHIRYASNNTANVNTVIDCTTGIWMEHSHTNALYHNSFVNNTIETSLPDSESNTWDNGYPSGGNYWSGYTGVDLYRGSYQNETGSDGIGDTLYLIDDDNRDRYPLMGTFSDFKATYDGETHHVSMISNSTVSDFKFDSVNRILNFDVGGPDGTIGFCRIIIPRALIEAPYAVLVNGEEVSYVELPLSNSTHAFLYFTYSHTTRHIKIMNAEASYIDVTILDLTALPTTVFVGDIINIDVLVEVTGRNVYKSVTMWLWYDNKAMTVFAFMFRPGFTGHFTQHIYFEWWTGNIEPGSYIVSANVTGDDDPVGNEYIFGPVTALGPIVATIDIDPDTLNQKSRGKWITVYIELPEGYDVSDVDVDTVWLRHNWFGSRARWGEYTQNDVFMVKFDRRHLIEYLKAEATIDVEVTLTITGKADGTLFEGTDTIRVMDE